MGRPLPRVAITGMGVVSPAAVGVKAFAEALRNGHRTLSTLAGVPVPRGKALVGRVLASGFDGPDKAMRMAEAAAREAADASGGIDPNAALLVGTIAGFGEEAETHYPDIVAGRDIPGLDATLRRFPNGAVADHLAAMLGLVGPRAVATNACASGNIALGLALDWIRLGRCGQALVVGLDIAKLTTIWGAERSGFIGRALRPFDLDRDGSVLGDGAAALVLCAESRLDGAPPLAWLDGFGCVCDRGAGAITLNADGSGLRRAMAEALRDGAASPRDIGYVSAHAPGTKGIDLIETGAVADLFPAGAHPAINSTKSITTHLAGASAIAEVVATVLQMTRGFVHGNIGLVTPDPALRCAVESAAARRLRFDAALSNACGGGGANTSVLVRAAASARPTPAVGLDLAGIVVTGAARLVPAPGAVRCAFDIRDHYPPDRKYHFCGRAAQLAAVAAARALAGTADIAKDRVAVVAGTTLGGSPQAVESIASGLAANPDALLPSHALDHGMHLGATLICRHHDFTGATITLTGSASSGALAVLVAADLLRAGRADKVVAVAYDAWDEMLDTALAGLPDCRAALRREGEGAAALVLERRGGSIARDEPTLAELVGADFRPSPGRPGAFFAATPLLEAVARLERGQSSTFRVETGGGAAVEITLRASRQAAGDRDIGAVDV